MSRTSLAIGSFNELLREHLRNRHAIDRSRALRLLHAHFGDRVSAGFGRAAQLGRLASGALPLELDAGARLVLQRACEAAAFYLPEDSPYLAALRRADLALAGRGLRTVAALPANGGRPVLLFVHGLAPDAAAGWLESVRPLDVVVLLGPEEHELVELLPLLDELAAAPAPLLCVLPQGELRSGGCRWLSRAAGEGLGELVHETLDVCARHLGAAELQQGSLSVRAVASGGQALGNALREAPELALDAIHLEDALYADLPWRLLEYAATRAGLCLSLDVLPHQAEAARRIAPALPPGRVEIRVRRPVERLRQLLHKGAILERNE
jgi:hypothetical protein